MLSVNVSLAPAKDGRAPEVVLHGDTLVQEQVRAGRNGPGRWVKDPTCKGRVRVSVPVVM